MTTIQVNEEKIIVKGHSGYDTIGKDIVCAAISVLSEATYNYLVALGNEVVKEEGDAAFIIDIRHVDSAGKKIVGSFIEMVDDIASQYPKNVRRIK